MIDALLKYIDEEAKAKNKEVQEKKRRQAKSASVAGAQPALDPGTYG